MAEDNGGLQAEVDRLRRLNGQQVVQIEKLKEAVNRPHERGPDDDGVRYCEACGWLWPCGPSQGKWNPVASRIVG